MCWELGRNQGVGVDKRIGFWGGLVVVEFELVCSVRGLVVGRVVEVVILFHIVFLPSFCLVSISPGRGWADVNGLVWEH